jgi:hypothetical protein
MIPGRIYKHKNSTDVAFKVIGITNTGHLWGQWINIHFYCVHGEDTIKIEEQDLSNWSEYEQTTRKI